MVAGTVRPAAVFASSSRGAERLAPPRPPLHPHPPSQTHFALPSRLHRRVLASLSRTFLRSADEWISSERVGLLFLRRRLSCLVPDL